MKKCNNCGCINEDTQMFCGQCGSKLNDFSIDTTQDSQNTYYTQPQPPQQQFTSSQYPTPPTNDKPKKKKKMHVQIVNNVIDDIKQKLENGGYLNDADFRKALQEYKL